MSITEHDLQRLIDGHAVEGPALEFKRQLDIRTRGEKAEALKDLTGMANAGGGRIVYGIDEHEMPVRASSPPSRTASCQPYSKTSYAAECVPACTTS